MTIRRPRQGSIMPNKGNVYGLNLNTPKAPKSPGVVALSALPTPTPGAQGVGIARASVSELEPVGVSGIEQENIQENSDISKASEEQSLGVAGVKEQSEAVGVGTPMKNVAQINLIYNKKFNFPRRMLAMPSWNSIVTYNTIKEPNAGALFNSETTYADWYTAFAIAAIDDDYISVFGIITRQALPQLWPNGPKQALLEANQAGIQISNNSILQPGEAFLNWMFLANVNPWLRIYIDNKYPNGINILGGL